MGRAGMGRVIAGIQAGVVTLIFILLAAFGYISLVATGWALLLAGLGALGTYIFRGSSSIAIAIMIVVIGLACAGVYLVSGLATLAVSLAAGVILGVSWAIAVSYSLPGRRGF